MQFVTLDGKRFRAGSLEELAHQLWQSAFMPEPTIDAWMTASAQRALTYNGAIVRTDDVAGHVRDLIAGGYVTLAFAADLRGLGLRHVDLCRIVAHLTGATVSPVSVTRWATGVRPAPALLETVVELLKRLPPEEVQALRDAARAAG